MVRCLDRDARVVHVAFNAYTMFNEVRILGKMMEEIKDPPLMKQILFSGSYQLSCASSTPRMQITSDDNNRDAIRFVHD